MLRHIFKITLRNIFKTKLNSSINIFGLSLGIAVSILVLLFIKDELTHDTFHSKSSSLYRVYNSFEQRDGTAITSPFVPFIAGKSLKENFEEVQGHTAWTTLSSKVIWEGEPMEQPVSLVSSDFFNMFDFKKVKGSVKNVFENPTDLVITEKTAKKYFGEEDPIGKTVTLLWASKEKIFEVKAVTEDPPSNSSLKFEALISMENAKDRMSEEAFTHWHWTFSESFVLLNENNSGKQLEGKIPGLLEKLRDPEELKNSKYALGLQPMPDIHLDTEMGAGELPVSDPKYTLILSGIALVILLMACINFMNLSLARSLVRTREIGVKKVVGAGKLQLVFQFLGEALWISYFSLIVGIFAARLSLPLFNELSGKDLVFEFSPLTLSIFIGLATITGILAGLYPAFVLSSFQPVKVLKGQLAVGQGKQELRKVMLGVQLALSAFLITSVIIMNGQMDFIRNKNLGYNKDQLVSVQLNVPRTSNDLALISDGMEKGKLLSKELKQLPVVEGSTLSAHTFDEGGWMTLGYNDKETNTLKEFNFNVVDEHYIPLLEIELVEGRNFERDSESDFKRGIIVNESFLRNFGIEDPIGSQIPHNAFGDHAIIGVVKDFHINSLHQKIEPAIMAMTTESIFKGIENMSINSSFVPKIFVKLKAGFVGQGLKDLEDRWKTTFPDESFSYSFIEDKLAEQYEADGNFGEIVQWSTVVATLIGALGLFGIVSLTLTARLREVSIRKTLGAGIPNLIRVLSTGYFLVMFAAILIAVPLTWVFTNNWLSSFEYRIEPQWFHFLSGGFLLILIGVLAMGWQTAKIAFTNPVEHLKTE